MLDVESSLDEIDLFVERTFVQLLIQGWGVGTAVSNDWPFVTLSITADFSMIGKLGKLIFFYIPHSTQFGNKMRHPWYQK